MPLSRLMHGRVRQGHVLLAWIIVFTAAVAYGVAQNRQRITDIQQANVTSCRRTYEGVREIFDPFREASPNAENWKRFDNRVDELKAKCDHQVNEGGAR